MQVVIIHGSPRKKNTYGVVELVKKEMIKYGEVKFIDVFLSDKKLTHCKGCFSCFTHGEKNCKSFETVQPIVCLLEESDGFILTSPVYSLQVSGILKTFIDHISYYFHRPALYKKKALIITTTAGAGHKDAAKYMAKVAYSWGTNKVYLLAIRMFADNLSGVKGLDRKVSEISKIYYKSLSSGKLSTPSYLSVIMFNAWKAMALSGGLETDREYWKQKGWLNKECFYYTLEAPVGFTKKLVGKIVLRVMTKIMKKG